MGKILFLTLFVSTAVFSFSLKELKNALNFPIGNRACCYTKEIYGIMNERYREINKDLIASEVLIKMLNAEILHTVDIMQNRIDEERGVDFYESEELDNEINSIHRFFKVENMPEQYDLNQIIKIAETRNIHHDKLINHENEIKNKILGEINKADLDRNDLEIQRLESKFIELMDLNMSKDGDFERK